MIWDLVGLLVLGLLCLPEYRRWSRNVTSFTQPPPRLTGRSQPPQLCSPIPAGEPVPKDAR